MKSDIITVSSKGSRMEQAFEQAEKVAVFKNLSAKSALHLRLLTEEMMGMMRSLTGETDGQFWIEDQGDEYQLHLKVFTPMNIDKRERLLAASTSGRNEAAKGLMGRLRDFFDQGADAVSAAPLYNNEMSEYSSTPALDWEWSMVSYENELNRLRADDENAQAAWDELEKSVVTHVADDVKVSIRGPKVEMTIIKKMT